MDVSPQTVQNVLAATGAERLIHGHTHRPGMHELRVGERACSRIVLDAWYDGGQYLAIDGARVESRRLRPAAPNGIETADPAR
jgi:UDP-2,3-diacylglucosamine hydrolase